MAYVSSIAIRLRCQSCNNFQGTQSNSTYAATGKCRKMTPLPVLQSERALQWSNWPTTTAADDICSYHTQAGAHPDDLPDPGGGGAYATYSVQFAPVLPGGAADLSKDLVLTNQTQSQLFSAMSGGGTYGTGYVIGVNSGSNIDNGCYNCQYWVPNPSNSNMTDDTNGTCHRKRTRPVAANSQGVLLATWLTTAPYDWCSYQVPVASIPRVSQAAN